MKKLIATFLCVILTAGTFLTGLSQNVAAYSSGVEGYVERLYDLVMSRTPDPTGEQFWIDYMNNGGTAAHVAQCFFESPEFIEKSLTTDEYVNVLYRSILGRENDPAGFNYWVNRVTNGVSRRAALAMFVDSPEFRSIASDFGVECGNIVLTDPVDVNFRISEFVTSAYRITLGRAPDQEGLSYWVASIADNRINASEFVASLVASQEIKAKNLSDNEYISLIYRSFLGRDCNTPEANYWINEKVTRNVSWRYIMNLISDSSEFATRCSNYGVVPGRVTLEESRDSHAGVNSLVISGYRAVYGRYPTSDEANYWVNSFINGTEVKDFYNQIFASDSFASLSLEDRIAIVYEAALGRSASSSDISGQTSIYNERGFDGMLDGIYRSEEFQSRCNAQGVVGIYIQGIYRINGRARYFDGTRFAPGGWQRYNGYRYYFDEGGWMATGWKYINGLKYYFDENGRLVQNVDPIIGRQDRYLVKVNCQTNVTTVYAKDEHGNFVVPVIAFLVSTGLSTSRTIQGTFTLSPGGRWRELMGPVWGQYCTRISGNYLFHSVWYYRDGDIRSMSVSAYRMLGQNASHGCVRMTVADAKWIYEHCIGSTCVTYYGPEDCPFDRPGVAGIVPVGGDYGYDLSDPAVH